jgi:hypothetical protein
VFESFLSEQEEPSPTILSPGPAQDFYITNGITYTEHVANKRKKNEQRLKEQGFLHLLNKPSETKQKKTRKRKESRIAAPP